MIPPPPPLENKESAEELVNTFTLFSSFLSLIFLIFLNVISVGWAHLGESCSLQYAIGWFNKSRYEDIRYLLLIQNEPNASKELLSSYYQYSWCYKTMEDGKSFY